MSYLKKFVLTVFVFVVVESSITTSALAYVIAGSPWPGAPVTLTYGYINVFDGGLRMPDGNPLPNSLIRGSIEESLQLWSSVAPLNFVEVPSNGPVQPQLAFRHVFINGPDPPLPADPIAKAVATCVGFGTACEVRYDDSDRWQEVGTQPVPDILGASIHEIGHILGLYHTDVVGANMYWIFHRFSGLGTGQLFPDDIAGIQALYGAGSGSVVTLSGDFNSDATVDAADYVVWRKGLGSIFTQDDYNVWRAHFRQNPGGGSGSAEASPPQFAVPEPTAALLSLPAGGWFLRRRVRQPRQEGLLPTGVGADGP